ncbi:hypothetical protein [Pectobacterium phage PEAT2]|uniref:Uncharacterized protein n=1 Tax=Pectobacterium phage PEAT2 TaxID=2053078 RepID=A0A2H4N7F1_9CAUD|nr:hypothetical protein F8206_gp45 [Pectobacterium phage PEAT2]ATV25117.1 hypothetical protein [Pectobacterium phage PEAT2]
MSLFSFSFAPNVKVCFIHHIFTPANAGTHIRRVVTFRITKFIFMIRANRVGLPVINLELLTLRSVGTVAINCCRQCCSREDCQLNFKFAPCFTVSFSNHFVLSCCSVEMTITHLDAAVNN